MPIRLSVRHLMFWVALVGILLGSFRFHFSVGSFVAGMVAITAVRSNQKIKQRRALGMPISDGNRLAIIARSSMVASVLLTASFLPSLILLAILFHNFIGYRHAPRLDPGSGVLILGILGWPFSVAMRRLIW